MNHTDEMLRLNQQEDRDRAKLMKEKDYQDFINKRQSSVRESKNEDKANLNYNLSREKKRVDEENIRKEVEDINAGNAGRPKESIN